MAYNFRNALVNLNEEIRKSGGGGGGDLPAVKLEVSQLKVDVVKVSDQVSSIMAILANISEYSETEVKVGKYLGEDLYRRTWVFDTALSLASNTWTSSSVPKAGMTQIVKAEAIDSSGSDIFIMCSIDDSTFDIVRVNSVRPSGSVNLKQITLWYTKNI